MGKKVSVTGWVPKNESEMETLEGQCNLHLDDIKNDIENGIYLTKKEAVASGESNEWKKIRITVEINAEKL